MRTVFAFALVTLLAAGTVLAELRAPTFTEVHLAVVRLVRNEAGNSVPDADGIVRAMAVRARNPDRSINLGKLMDRMVRHSPRTFPLDSPWRVLVGPKRLRYVDKLRTQRNRWSSAMTLDCARPEGWLSHERWSTEACFVLVDAVRSLLRGEMRSRCDGQPHTWGSLADVAKRQIRTRWTEITCDRWRARVPGNSLDCHALRAQATNREGRRALLNSTECARNTFWRWR